MPPGSILPSAAYTCELTHVFALHPGSPGGSLSVDRKSRSRATLRQVNHTACALWQAQVGMTDTSPYMHGVAYLRHDHARLLAVHVCTALNDIRQLDA